MFPRWMAVLWVILGFALGGSVEWAISQPNQQAHISAANSAANPSGNQHQPSKTFGERLSIIWDRTWEDPVAFYTFVLGVFTFCLVAVSFGQGYFLFRSDRTARIAANAAKRSADAAIAIELPIIRADLDGFVLGSRRGAANEMISSVGIDSIVLSNLGRTKAFPIEVRFGYTVGDRLPEPPIYPFAKDFTVNFVIESELTHKFIREFEFDVPSDIIDKLRSSSTRLWFYCNLIYLDFMQTRHEAAFCWERWQRPGRGGFRDDPTPAYNRKT